MKLGKNVFTSKALFVLEKDILLNNVGSKYSLLMKFDQFMSLQKKKFYQKTLQKLVPGPLVFGKN